MAVFYVDTSAALKRYKTERGSDVVDELYDALHKPGLIGAIWGDPRDVLVTSHMTCLETESVAARALKGNLLDDEAYGTLLNAFARDLERFAIVPVSAGMVMSAIHHARTCQLRPADAIHFATAHDALAFASPDRLVVVTSDREILEACDALGLETLDPEAENAMEKLRKYRDR